MNNLTAVLESLRSIQHQDISWELRKLQGIRKWALKQLNVGYDVGDRVQIISPRPGNVGIGHGWYGYHECLAYGATAVVKNIDFNLSNESFYADIVLDREWVVSTYKEGMRYWHGPVEDTPEGYEPPSKYEQETYPQGRKHTFMMPVEWLGLIVGELS